MNCRECSEHLYEYLDRELTPQVEREIRAHIADCPPCGEHFDFERVFLTFLRARSRAQGDAVQAVEVHERFALEARPLLGVGGGSRSRGGSRGRCHG